MSYVIGILILVLTLGIHPLLLGAALVPTREKRIDVSFLYGMLGEIAACLLWITLCAAGERSLGFASKGVALWMLLSSVAVIFYLIRSRGYFALPERELKPLLTQYLLPLGLLLVFAGICAVFSRDLSSNSVLEQALVWVQSNSLNAVSPYSGRELTLFTGCNGLAGFYAVISRLSGIHVTLIGKLLMPFVTVILFFFAWKELCHSLFEKREQRAVWVLCALCLLFAVNRTLVPGLPLDFAGLWISPWSGGSLCVYVFLPVLVWILLKRRWHWDYAVLFLIGCLDIVLCLPVSVWFTCGQEIGSFQNLLKENVGSFGFILILAFAVILLLWALPSGLKQIGKTKQSRQNKKNGQTKQSGQQRQRKQTKSYLICLHGGIALLVLVVSFVTGSCAFSRLSMAKPDNRFKMDAQVMELREMAEQVSDAKMLAPMEVAAQMRDGDLKVSLLFGPEILSMENQENDLRIKEAAGELVDCGYDAVKLIQHGTQFGCNLIVAYKNQENEALFHQYGYAKLGETTDYELYRYVGEALNQYEITAFMSTTGNQSMCYAIRDYAGHLIMVDGGWVEDEDMVRDVIKLYGGKVDAWILTHPHPDHIGAFNEIYEAGDVEIGQIYAVPMNYERYRREANWWDMYEVCEKFESLIQKASNLNYVREGDSFELFGLKLEVLHSFDEAQLDRVESKDICNDGSMIFKLSGQQESILFLGDVGACMSEELLQAHSGELKSDYVQMGHHGNGGVSEAVYQVIAPKAAFFDLPESIMEDPQYNAVVKQACMESLGSAILSYKTAPNTVVIK